MRKMTQGSIARHLIAYALPLILGNLFQLTYNAVDSIVIGKFAGENALVSNHSDTINFDATPGDYTYIETATGKRAFGIVKVGPQSKRDSKAQRNAGGEDRRDDDQGGHLIAYVLGGVTNDSNLDAQNKNVNQRDVRRVENRVKDLASDPNNIVYYDVENLVGSFLSPKLQ